MALNYAEIKNFLPELIIFILYFNGIVIVQ